MDTLLRRSTGLFREEIRIKLRMILAASMNSDLPGLADTTLSGLKRGDSGALETVMGQYQHRLYRFLIRLTQDPAAAEDLFQQTWLRVIEKIGRYDARRQFTPWLFSVARNLAIDYLRKRREISLDISPEPGVSPIERLAAAGSDPLERLLEFERGATLVAAVAKLPVIHREVLTLRFEEDMKLEQIAEILGVPLSTVKSRLLRAMESLRGRLQ
jgi:RNA polymerase sigma-70 factor (ECF subfamily)